MSIINILLISLVVLLAVLAGCLYKLLQIRFDVAMSWMKVFFNVLRIERKLTILILEREIEIEKEINPKAENSQLVAIKKELEEHFSDTIKREDKLFVEDCMLNLEFDEEGMLKYD